MAPSDVKHEQYINFSEVLGGNCFCELFPRPNHQTLFEYHGQVECEFRISRGPN